MPQAAPSTIRRAMHRRLKLLILDTCYSGAASHAAARFQIGLDRLPVRQEDAAGQALRGTSWPV